MACMTKQRRHANAPRRAGEREVCGGSISDVEEDRRKEPVSAGGQGAWEGALRAAAALDHACRVWGGGVKGRE